MAEEVVFSPAPQGYASIEAVAGSASRAPSDGKRADSSHDPVAYAEHNSTQDLFGADVHELSMLLARVIGRHT